MINATNEKNQSVDFVTFRQIFVDGVWGGGDGYVPQKNPPLQYYNTRCGKEPTLVPLETPLHGVLNFHAVLCQDVTTTVYPLIKFICYRTSPSI